VATFGFVMTKRTMSTFPISRILLCWLLLTPFVFLAAQPRDLLPNDTSVIRKVLPNGFTFYLKKNAFKSAHQVELRLLVNAGSLQEEDDQRGIAHFVEHMAFNGTQHFSQAQLFQAFKRSKMQFGLDANAHTFFDYTDYQLKARSDSLQYLLESLDILQDWATGLRFQPQEVEMEKGVVLAEKRERNNPMARFQNSMSNWLYAGSRFVSRPIIGDSATLANATPALLERFYQDWYRPDLMCLIAVGDIDLLWLEKQIQEKFGRIPQKRNPPAWIKHPDSMRGNRNTLHYFTPVIPTASVGLSFKSPDLHGLKTTSDIHQRAINNLLLNLVNDQLNNLDVVRQNGLNCNFGWQFDAYADLSNHFLLIDSSPGLLQNAYRNALGVLIGVAKGAFSESELEQQRKSLIAQSKGMQGRIGVGLENAIYVSDLLNLYLYQISPTNIPAIEELFSKAYAQISKTEIIDLAKSLLLPANQSMVFLAAEDQRKAAPDSLRLWAVFDSIQTIEHTMLSVGGGEHLKPWFAEPLPDSAEIVARKQFKHEVEQIEYSNGLKVLLKPLKQDGRIYIKINSRGGYDQLPVQQVLAGKLLEQVIQQSGVARFSYPSLLRKTKALDLNLQYMLHQNEESIIGDCAKAQLEDLLSLLHLRMTDPYLEQIALDKLIALEKRRVMENLQNPYLFLDELHNRKDYPQQPTRRLPDESALEALTLEQMKAVYTNRFLNTRDFTIAIVGDFAVDSILPQLHRYFGTLKEQGDHETYVFNSVKKSPRTALDTTIYMLPDNKAVVELSYFGLSENTKGGYSDYYMMVWEKILEQKLFLELREKRSAIYHVNVQGTYLQGSDFGLKVLFQCDPGQVNSLVLAADSIIYASCDRATMASTFEALQAKFAPSSARPSLSHTQDVDSWMWQLTADPENAEQMINAFQPDEAEAANAPQKTPHFPKPKGFRRELKNMIKPERRWEVVLMPLR